MTQKVGQMGETDFSYARMLEGLGNFIYWADDVPWYRYNGFLRPAFLPHVCPKISASTARKGLNGTGAMFARWEYPADHSRSTEWWRTNRRGGYSLSDLSGNTRSKVRRGRRRFEIRSATEGEIREQAYDTCRAAARRYGSKGFLPSPSQIEALANAIRYHPKNLEVIAAFQRNRMMAFSVNHIHQNAVLFDTIWLDPEGLSCYSSYALFDFMLNRYLEEQGRDHVSDGVRTLHHESGVHKFLVSKFGFNQEYADLHVVYRPIFSVVVRGAYPFREVVHLAAQCVPYGPLKKASGILAQEAIVRAGRVDKCIATKKRE